MANFANNSTDRLREMQMKGEEVQNPEYFANLINGCPLKALPETLGYLLLPRNRAIRCEWRHCHNLPSLNLNMKMVLLK